ncbi:hypothetical protein F5X99DRAFT_428350 [Biscogniauxia marginata]|nr:hypothetical protein F5X99DRAFT_428350 [Biscogniauxia marginata]
MELSCSCNHFDKRAFQSIFMVANREALGLDEILDLDHRLCILLSEPKRCGLCSVDASMVVDVLKVLHRLSIFYEAARISCSGSALGGLSGDRDEKAGRAMQQEQEVTRGTMEGTAIDQGVTRMVGCTKTPIMLGRFMLTGAEADLIAFTMIREGLSRTWGFVKDIRTELAERKLANRVMDSQYEEHDRLIDSISDGIYTSLARIKG